MSIRLMTQVWEKSKATGSALLVLLALADNANDESYCWPSLNTISKKSRVNKRQVIRIIKDLETMGEIRVQHRYNGINSKTNIYWITPPVGDVEPLTSTGSDTMSLGGSGLDVTRGSGLDVTRVVVPTSLKSSVNHQSEPSREDEEEINSSLSEIATLYEKTFGCLMTSMQGEKLKTWSDDYGLVRVKDALEKTAMNNGRSLAYTERILMNKNTSPNGKKPAKEHKRYDQGQYADFIEH